MFKISSIHQYTGFKPNKRLRPRCSLGLRTVRDMLLHASAWTVDIPILSSFMIWLSSLNLFSSFARDVSHNSPGFIAYNSIQNPNKWFIFLSKNYFRGFSPNCPSLQENRQLIITNSIENWFGPHQLEGLGEHCEHFRWTPAGFGAQPRPQTHFGRTEGP